MREGTILTVLIDSQIPDNRSQKDNRRFYEEVALLLNPSLVQVEHYRVRTLVCITDIYHKLRVDGITAV